MNKLIFLLPVLIVISGCATTGDHIEGVAPPPALPTLPPTLAKKASPLPDLVGKTLAEREKEDSATDQIYNGVATQLNALIDVYVCVKTSLAAKTDLNLCLKK